jgi:hypothetical protein
MRRWLLLLAFGAVTTGATAQVPAFPAPRLEQELRDVRPGVPVRMRFDDRAYVVIEHRWLTGTFLPYFRSFLLHLHAGTSGGEGYDCDNFAMLFRAKLMLSNMLAGGARRAEVPCGRLTVAQRAAFGGVPGAAGALHALVVVRTDSGWFVVEPQTCTIVELRNYPNLGNITEVSF